MSRSGYSDDCEQVNLWRGAVERATKGKRGQKFLKELAEEMDKMPEKVLIADALITAEGYCCPIGVVCKSRGLDVSKIDYDCPSEVGKFIGVARALAAEIEFENDEGALFGETPENRWTRMRKWVEGQIIS